MASEKAKELARKQKAQLKAEKERKKHSDNPADWGQLRQMREMYKLTAKENPKFPWLLLGGFLVPLIVLGAVGFFLHPLWMWIVVGVLAGVAGALLVFNQQIRRATYSRVEGQPGSAQVALDLLPKEWSNTPAINANREMDVVHRAVGPAGVVLVGEGDARRVKAMLSNEAKRHATASHNLVVTTIVMGDGDDQVPLRQLTNHIKKLPKKYGKAEIEDINRRVKALDNIRPRLGGMPKGPISAKGARKAMRGH